MFNKLKPKKVNIIDKLAVINPKDIIYLCKSQVVDKVIFERTVKDHKWDQEFADMMDMNNCFYFVVTNKMEYGMVSGTILQPWLMYCTGGIDPDAEIFTRYRPSVVNKASNLCFEHCIKSLL